MAKMNNRATFALDDETVSRLKKLSLLWHVSQAEVVRKAVKIADRQIEEKRKEKLSNLYLYQEKKGLDPEAADAYLLEASENRAEWRHEK